MEYNGSHSSHSSHCFLAETMAKIYSDLKKGSINSKDIDSLWKRPKINYKESDNVRS